MAEPFKHFINAALVRRAASHLQRVDASFPGERFVDLVLPQLDALELKARALLVADALEATLPADFHDAAATIERALASARPGTSLAEATAADDGLAGWILWPVGEFVARRGLAHPRRALAALHAITQRFTAEFAIRPLLERHPALVFETLAEWVHDPSEHVRRLVSEGTRPRLPWGMQLRALRADPASSLPLLAALQDDSSPYVRRSVANHLNDIAKDHPELVVDWVARHLPGAGPERTAVLRHASRTLVKGGHRRLLSLWGVGAAFEGTVTFSLDRPAIRLGAAVTLQLTLTSASPQLQRVAVDYVVHHVKANGTISPKVFKGWVLEVGPGETVEKRRRHAMKPITTRRYHAGRHRVELQVNGHVMAEAAVQLEV